MPSLKEEYPAQNVKKIGTRRTGLALPLKDNGFGGLQLVSGEENDFKIISLAVMSNSNTNAFQQPTVDIDEAVFEIDDITFLAMVRRKLEAVFADFDRQHRYRLTPGSIRIESNQPGETFVFFSYHNLEADTAEDMSVQLGSNV